jgi:hypothetical protein
MGSPAAQADVLKIPKAIHKASDVVDFLGVIADEAD